MSEKRSSFERLITALPGRFDDFLRAIEPHMNRLEAWRERLKARIDWYGSEAARIQREKVLDQLNQAEVERQAAEMRRKHHLRAMSSGDDDPDEAS